MYTTKAERHEGQKRKTARTEELMRSVVMSLGAEKKGLRKK